MARGSSKLGRRGRGREVAEEAGPGTAWSTDGAAAPAAPSPARTILPGAPFEPAASAFPAQRSPEPAPFPATTPAGWGFAPAPGAPVPGMPTATEPGLYTGEAATLSWPSDEPTGPIPAVPAYSADPLDALQQYAGLPLGAAPAPDPAQLYQPSHLAASSALSGEVTTQTLTAPAYGARPAPAGAPAGGADSGFADGGIFTGSEPFPGFPTSADPLAPGLAGGFGPQVPGGYVPQSSLEPLDVTPGPASPFTDVLLPADESEGGRRAGRRRSGGRRRDRAQVDATETAPSSGGKRAVALLGAVAVLGAAGYLGYSQLSGSDETVAGPTPVAKPATATRYALPNQLANLVQITPAQTKALTASYAELAARNTPELPVALIATAYHPQHAPQASVNVVVFRPGSTAVYEALVGSLSRPGAGSASVAATPVAPGAAAGTMTCGSQRGTSSAAWCAWNSGKGMGFVQAKGTSNTAYAAVYTRELRAFAER